MSKSLRKIFRNIFVIFAVAGLLVVGARIRARCLPDVEVPVLLYERVENAPSANKYTVGGDLFYMQLRDFAKQGYTSVKPWRLNAYKKWGWPLPEKPIIITFDRAFKDLTTVAGPFLDDQDFKAVVLLATSLIANESLTQRRTFEGVEMMTWEEVRKASKDGVFSFGGHTRSRADLTLSEKPFNEIRASRFDIKKNLGVRSNVFSYPFGKYSPEIRKAARRAKIKFAMTYGDTVATVGPHTDMLAIPRIRVIGGRQVFAVEATESRTREHFGYVTAKRESGPTFEINVSVFYGNNPNPVVDGRADDALEIPLPYPASGFLSDMFPIRVEVRDSTGVLLYLATEIQLTEVTRKSGTTVNVSGKVDIDELDGIFE
jgi:peptidoglycan/xylan/chitin deacetylase (PgdA/CDA1 family)